MPVHRRSERPRVALIIETSKAYGRGLLLGIRSYLRAHRPWSIYIEERGIDDREPPWLSGWSGDGIITRSRSMRAARKAAERGIPVINLRYWEDFRGPPVPNVDCDQQAISNAVAEHFLDAGFRSLAFCGLPEHWARARRDAFATHAARMSAEFAEFDALPDLSWGEQQRALGRWVNSLPKPCGVMACNDVIGLRVLDACRLNGIRVPDELAVVGVDNDEVLCELSDPPLSSVDQNVQRIGHEAAALLDRMMDGEGVDTAPRLVQPRGIVPRASSDVIAIDDTAVARALHHLRSQPGQAVPVDDLARVAALSRRELERRFQHLLGRSPARHVTLSRLTHARALLLDTDEPLDRISELCGFRYQGHFSTWFKKHLGQSPGAFRAGGQNSSPAVQQESEPPQVQ